MNAQKFFRGALVGISMILGVSANAFATEIPPLEAGSYVRASVIDRASGNSGSFEVSGRVVSLDEAAITIRDSDNLLEIPRENIANLEVRVQNGRKLKGAGLGFLIGGALGAAMGYSGGDDPPGIMSMDAGGKAIAGGVTFGLIGALVGSLASPGEKWQEIGEEDLRWGLGPAPDGGGGVFLVRRF